MGSETPLDPTVRRSLITLLNENIETVAAQIAARLHEQRIESYSAVPRETLVRIVQNAVEAFLRDLAEDQESAFAAYWNTVAEARAAQGATLDDMLQAVGLSAEILDAFVTTHGDLDSALQIWWLQRLRTIIYTGVVALSHVFTVVRDRLINTQNATIRELLTPIIPIHEGILVLPLVGMIDTLRATQILETLLTGISEYQATVVLVDITGVPIVDTSVTHHLLQAARAAQLLGAEVVFVGIRPEIAQTITQLGADLSHTVTRSNLQSGSSMPSASTDCASCLQPLPSCSHELRIRRRFRFAASKRA